MVSNIKVTAIRSREGPQDRSQSREQPQKRLQGPADPTGGEETQLPVGTPPCL